MRKVGKYEVGRTIGEGTFAKVKFAQNTETGESVAMKVLNKETVLKHKMVDQVAPSLLTLLVIDCLASPKELYDHKFIQAYYGL